jgi:hypothetical protein
MTPKLDPRTPEPPEPPKSPYSELRRHQRLELPVRCWIIDGSHTVYLRVHDVSAGGLSVRAPGPFHPTGAVEIGNELPDGTLVRARGEVVWVRPDGGEVSGPRMGARFVEFLEGEEELYKAVGRA